MIAELEQIIQTEEAKPEAERDENLIDDCIREIAELKGVKAEYSDEEVKEITDKLIKKTEREKRKKRLVRYVAGIAAAFVLVGGGTACTINPAIINWLAKIVRMPFGSSIDSDRITYYYHGISEEYDGIEDLLKSNAIEIYYPAILPKNTTLNYVEVIEHDYDTIIYFKFSSDNFHYTVHLHYHEPDCGKEPETIITANGNTFDVYSEDYYFISRAEIEGNSYIIQANSINDIILVIGGLRKEQ
jgi:hypothetical protein